MELGEQPTNKKKAQMDNLTADKAQCKIKERPILFSGPMVRALLDGRKTQTRRGIKPQPDHLHRDIIGKPKPWSEKDWSKLLPQIGPREITCPFGEPGDRLWVREAHYITCVCSNECGIGYRATHRTGNLADGDGGYNFRSFSDDMAQAGEQWNWAQKNQGTEKWRPSIHMPRWASRITLEIVSVRVERLGNISRGDAMAEGCPFPNMAEDDNPVDWFRGIWQTIHPSEGPHGWAANPWVWVVEFKRAGITHE